MKQVIVTNPFLGIAGMQVCAHKDTTDKQILEVCNQENPSGTTQGWSQVVRTKEHGPIPVQCESHKNRLHFIIYC